jgi:hypothetical protein
MRHATTVKSQQSPYIGSVRGDGVTADGNRFVLKSVIRVSPMLFEGPAFPAWRNVECVTQCHEHSLPSMYGPMLDFAVRVESMAPRTKSQSAPTGAG